MAAYAALVSVMHIIEQIERHPHPPVSLHKQQVESLTHNVTFLQEFLEVYSSRVGYNRQADDLESRIADAAHAAEDVIESHIVDQILTGSTSDHGEKISSNIDFYKGLQKVIEEMVSIKKEVMEMKEKMGIQDQLQRNSSISAGSLKSPSSGHNITMVGFDDVLNEVMEKLIGQQSNLQLIPIVGMGGIGKTTLARNIYVNPLVVHHFDILVWVTISQEYSTREILLQVLLCQRDRWSMKELSQMSEDELGEILYKSLSGRRYLIIIDDVWSIGAWDKVKFFFPNNYNGSRIMITTKLSNLAFRLSGSNGLVMNFLDEDQSWNLLCRVVFGKDSCPLELEEVGKKIAKNCNGLPLSIVVIGGLLAKSQRTRENWDYIAENLNSIVNLEDNERCLQILYTSYNQLPVHLKPCFLYMGVFPEDNIVRISWLIKLWISEGFLKPIGSKSLEDIAEEYLGDLIDRNLVLAHNWGVNGKLKSCKIHDLLRDLCLREAKKQKFFYSMGRHIPNFPQGIDNKRRIVFHESTFEPGYLPQIFHPLQSAPFARSLICHFPVGLPGLNSSLLRVLQAADKDFYSGYGHSLQTISRLVNLRFIAIKVVPHQSFQFPSSIQLFWNLQTLIFRRSLGATAPSEIWKMPQLRHVQFDRLELPDPPSGHMEGSDDLVLSNLQTLLQIRNFKCSEEVVKRIPNIKKLKICYDEFEGGSGYCLDNLVHLHKLESLGCFFYSKKPKPKGFLENLSFPHSLKKLTLEGSQLPWEDMTAKIGSLPHLQVLKLGFSSFIGPEWETVEGQFCSLKFLEIDSCNSLKYWTTDSTDFPCLEHLVLAGLDELEEIPSGIGRIPTLQSIELTGCSSSAIISAREILEEQEELGNEGLQVRVVTSQYDKVLQSLACQNFRVQNLEPGNEGSTSSLRLPRGQIFELAQFRCSNFR